MLITGKADDEGKTLEKAGGDDATTLARASEQDILKAFGHYRHYNEQSMTKLLESAGFIIEKMYRYQFLFESEMMCFHFSLKGFQSKYLYPFMKMITCLDYLLPRSYPGVGLLVVARKG
jgi:hypothetical protein